MNIRMGKKIHTMHTYTYILYYLPTNICKSECACLSACKYFYEPTAQTTGWPLMLTPKTFYGTKNQITNTAVTQ